VSQRLVSKIDGGRLLVRRSWGAVCRTRETLLYGENENRTFQEIIEAGGTNGWHSFDNRSSAAYKTDLITDEDRDDFSARTTTRCVANIDMVKKLRNSAFDEPSGLRMEW